MIAMGKARNYGMMDGVIKLAIMGGDNNDGAT